MEYETTTLFTNLTLFKNETGYSHDDNQDMKKLSQFIYDHICPALTLIGIFSNIATLITLTRPPLNSHSVSIYLIAYCSFAILQWVFIIGLDWLLETINYSHFRSISHLSCRIYSFLQRVVSYSCFWFVTGSAIDRVIVLWLPRKSQSFCTVFMAKNAVAFIMIGLTVVSIHAMWTHYYYDEVCYFGSHELFAIYWLYTSTFFLSWLPMILLFIFCNMLVIHICLKNSGGNISDLSRQEMELTYTVLIFAFLTFFCGMPISVVYVFVLISMGDKNSNYDVPMEFATYITWLCYLSLFFVIICRSSEFRDALKELFSDCAKCLIRRGSNIELHLMKGEYDQVPSTSTSV